jgi:sporulation protein YlmC with PRC-barrel domain
MSVPASAQQTVSGSGARVDLDEIRKVSTLRKAEVLNQANEKIASVTDLILSAEGKVHYAVLSVEGVVGIGAKYTAIPLEKLDVRHVNGKWAVNLPMTKEGLEKAPMFESENYKELTNPQWVARVRNYFATHGTGTIAKDRDRTTDSSEPLSMVLRASKILGAPLQNSRTEKLGSIEDLLLDRHSRVAFAVAGHGGVLGIGESFIPVPWSKLKLKDHPEDMTIVAHIDATKDQIEQAPLIKGDSYATLLAPGFTDQVYRYFGVEKP